MGNTRVIMTYYNYTVFYYVMLYWIELNDNLFKH